MTRVTLISVSLVLVALAALGSADAVKQNYGGIDLPVYGMPVEVNMAKSFAPMEVDTIPPFPPYHNLPLYIAGNTYYDMQHNSSKGRNIAVDINGGVHVAWMDGITQTLSQRRAKYNYFHIDSIRGGDISTGWVCAFDGTQVDSRSKAGYVNIALDDASTVPTVVYHDVQTTEDPKCNAAFDIIYYLGEEGTQRCVFTNPSVGPDPYYPPEEPTFDCSAIWPKAAQIDTTVFMVSTCSNDTFTLPATGEKCGSRLIFYRGFIKPDEFYVKQLAFEPPVMIEDDQVDISCDLSAWKGPESNQIAMAYIWVDTVIANDTCYCTAENYYTTLYDAAALIVRRSSDMGSTWSAPEFVTEPMSHVYSTYPESIYVGYMLDSTVTPPETIQVYRPAYTRPVDLNITYSPDGVLHAVWGGFVLSPHEGWENSCAAACSVGAYQLEVLFHWDEARDVIDTVTWDPWWLFVPPTDYRPESFRTSQIGASHEPQVTVDEDGNIFVFWEQRWAEYWWCETGTLLIDNSRLNFPSSEIYCSVFSPDSGFWSDPLNISNTTTPGCSTGTCKSEIEVTVADRVDDNVHISFVIDSDAGLYPMEEGQVSLSDIAYLRLEKNYLIRTAYSGEDYITERVSPEVPIDFRLGSGYPNPFNVATAFWFDTYQAGKYSIDIVDITGRTVTQIHDGQLDAGRRRFVWDGFSDNGWYVPTGTYFVRAKDSIGNTITRKVTLLK